MPFTFSHPAIVLPLTYIHKRWYSLTGLIVGSLVPDFEYFMRLKVDSHHSHTIAGLFWFDIPIGFLLAFIYHNLVRNPLFDNLPKFLKSRVINFKNFNWNHHLKKNWLIVLLSIFIGAALHLFWDSFTHERAYFVEKFPILLHEVSIGGMSIQVCRIIQHTSTFVGGCVILFAFFRLPENDKTQVRISAKYWSIVALTLITMITLKLAFAPKDMAIGDVVATIISGFAAGLIIAAFFFFKVQ